MIIKILSLNATKSNNGDCNWLITTIKLIIIVI